MRVIGKTTTESETSVDIDLFQDRELPTRAKKRIQDEVGNFLVEQTLVAMDQKKSPVQGEGNFKALSPDYKKLKQREVGSTEANLEFDGVMKDELNFEPTPFGISLGVFGDRAPAADGHNNLSGKSSLPTRRFLPDEGQNYKAQIAREVDRIVADIVAEESKFKKSMFKEVTTKAELYTVLKNIFGEATRAELKLAVFRNEELTDMLDDLNLLDLL